MASASRFKTELAAHDRDHIWIRGIDLASDAMGARTFSEVVYLLVCGRLPETRELRLFDAVLVSLVEHGLTPSALVARVTYSVAPESLQGAVAAGLLGAGSVVLGSMEDCGRLLTEVQAKVASGRSRSQAIHGLVTEYRASGRRLPGIGHVIHTNGDPRASRLYDLAEECGYRGIFLETMEELAEVAEAVTGKRLPINVTGAVAAILLELGVPWRLHRGFALISRSAGLVAHVGEELTSPITPALRQLIREGVAPEED